MADLIHTADLHLGRHPKSAGYPLHVQREIDSIPADGIDWITRFATEEKATAILFAGDTFDGTYDDGESAHLIKNNMRAYPNLHFIFSPGNHDPVTASQPYADIIWPKNAHIFRSPEIHAYTIPGADLTIYGHAWPQGPTNYDPFKKIRIQPRAAHAKNILLAHATELGSQPPHWKQYAPFTLDHLDRSNLDYVALGHLHDCIAVAPDDPCPVYYSGNPWPLSATDTGHHGVLSVTFQKPRTLVRYHRNPSVHFRSEVLALHHTDTWTTTLQRLQAYSHPPEVKTILTLQIFGQIQDRLHDQLQRIVDHSARHFLHLDVQIDTLPDRELTNKRATSGTFLNFLKSIEKLLSEAPAGPHREALAEARTHALAYYAGQPKQNA